MTVSWFLNFFLKSFAPVFARSLSPIFQEWKVVSPL